MGDRFAHLGLDDRERQTAAHFLHLAQAAYERGAVRFTSFLDERGQAIAACAAQVCAGRPYGGFPAAQRVVFGFAEDVSALADDVYPIEAVLVRHRRQDVVGHRDLLGALMSLGIKRETIGDILVGEGEAVVFLLSAVAPAVVQELTRVGGVGVSCSLGRPEALPAVRMRALEGVAASLRLDCIVAMAAKKSRSEAVRMIRSGLVARAGRVVTDPAREIAAGESLSIRGCGKFVLRSVGAVTRSGRYHISYDQYI